MRIKVYITTTVITTSVLRAHQVVKLLAPLKLCLPLLLRMRDPALCLNLGNAYGLQGGEGGNIDNNK